MTLAIVTPWWNHHDLQATYQDVIDACPAAHFFIVDNGSSPPIELRDQANTSMIKLEKNWGFSRACNFGLNVATHKAQFDRIVFLNNDVTVVGKFPLDQLDDELSPGVLVGAELRAGHHADIDGQAMPYLDGWCLAGMASDFDALDEGYGVWDERYLEPAYYGDNDLCLRAQARGLRLREAHVGLKHMGNHTTRDMAIAEVSAQNRQRYQERARKVLA